MYHITPYIIFCVFLVGLELGTNGFLNYSVKTMDREVQRTDLQGMETFSSDLSPVAMTVALQPRKSNRRCSFLISHFRVLIETQEAVDFWKDYCGIKISAFLQTLWPFVTKERQKHSIYGTFSASSKNISKNTLSSMIEGVGGFSAQP